MSNQGAPAQHRPEDDWWHAVYEGPAGTLPDTPGAVAGEGSVDDWFATAAGLIGAQRTAETGVPAEVTGSADGSADRSPRIWAQAGAETAGVDAERAQAGPATVKADPAPRDSAPRDSAPRDSGPRDSAPRDSDSGPRDPAAEGAPPVAAVDRPSLDDWFDTALGVIGVQRPSGSAPGPVPAERETEPAASAAPPVLEPPVLGPLVPDAPAPEPPASDAARRPVGARSSAPVEPVGPDETHRFPAPFWAGRTVPAAERIPEVTPDAVPDGAPAEVPAEGRATVPVLAGPVVPAAEPAPAVSSEEPAPAGAPTPVRSTPPAVPPTPVRSAPPAVPPAPVRSAPPVPAVPVRPAGRAGGAEPAAPAPPHVGERPPTYGPEPTAVPAADPEALGVIVPDTALEGAQYASATLRAASVRGDSARHRGEPRRDSLLVTRFGDGPDGLLLAVLGGYGRTEGQREPAPQEVAAATAEACRQLASAVGRSRAELAADLRAGARDRLRYGLQRLATGACAPLRALVTDTPVPVTEAHSLLTDAPEPPGAETRDEWPEQPPPGSLHCLLLSLDPEAAYRAAFGVGPGGLYLLRSGHWIDAYAARLLHHPDGHPPVPAEAVPDPRPFRFRLVPATSGDILVLCTPGLAGPIADEPAVAHFLASHWAHPHPPGTVDFLRQVQVRAKGYADDRTAAALWTE